jgi:hypothetical protein
VEAYFDIPLKQHQILYQFELDFVVPLMLDQLILVRDYVSFQKP